jgi:opacity protein-like surface antigen
MRNILLSASTTALMLVGAAAANAADLPPPPMPEPANWNFTVFGGASWLDSVDVDGNSNSQFSNLNADFDFDTGFLIGGAVGFTFVEWARTEIEVAYASYDVDSVQLTEDGVGGSRTFDSVDANFSALTVMGNMWFGFNMLPLVGNPVDTAGSGLGVSPYFGGGIGVGFVNNDGDDADSNGFEDSSTGLAWQVGAGIRWNFVSNIGLDLGYRYRNVTSVSFDNWDDADFSSQNVTLGVVFNF